MSMRGAAYHHIVSLLARGQSLEQSTERVSHVYPLLAHIELSALASLAVQSFAAGAAQSTLAEDEVLRDDQIPPVPDMQSPYLYTVEYIHNPGAVVHVDIASKKTLTWRQIMKMVQQAVADFPQDNPSPFVMRGPHGQIRVYPPREEEGVAPGTKQAIVHRVERIE